MTKPQGFILTSDYAALKNDNRGRITLNIPAGAVIPANGGSVTWAQEIELGTQNASLRTQMQSSLRPGEWTPGNMRAIDMTLNYSGSISTETGMVSVIRVSPTRLRLYCTHFNFAPFNISVVTGQTITADISTFLSPFN